MNTEIDKDKQKRAVHLALKIYRTVFGPDEDYGDVAIIALTMALGALISRTPKDMREKIYQHVMNALRDSVNEIEVLEDAIKKVH